MTTITADYFIRPLRLSHSSSAGNDGYRQEVDRVSAPAASSLQARAYAELAQIARECCEEGWDSYGAKPVTRATCDRVALFLDDLPAWMAAPDLVPEADGEIALEWYLGKAQTYSISIGEKGPLHYAGLFGQNQEVHGVEPFTDSVPARLLEFISEFLNKPAAR
jgi:hypothetical protein